MQQCRDGGGHRYCAPSPATAGLGAQERNQAVMKKLAAMWGELDAEQKQAFADDAPLVAVKPRKAKKGCLLYTSPSPRD